MWIVYPVIAWLFFTVVHCISVYMRKPIREADIEREMGRLIRSTIVSVDTIEVVIAAVTKEGAPVGRETDESFQPRARYTRSVLMCVPDPSR